MNQDETLPVSIVALRADAYSPDGKSVIISLKTRFSLAERKYSVPLECFYDLIMDLRRLNASADARSGDTDARSSDTDARSSEPSIQPTVAPKPAEHVDDTMADENSWERNH
jgi:hypothetical protein